MMTTDDGIGFQTINQVIKVYGFLKVFTPVCPRLFYNFDHSMDLHLEIHGHRVTGISDDLVTALSLWHAPTPRIANVEMWNTKLYIFLPVITFLCNYPQSINAFCFSPQETEIQAIIIIISKIIFFILSGFSTFCLFQQHIS